MSPCSPVGSIPLLNFAEICAGLCAGLRVGMPQRFSPALRGSAGKGKDGLRLRVYCTKEREQIKSKARRFCVGGLCAYKNIYKHIAFQKCGKMTAFFSIGKTGKTPAKSRVFGISERV